MRPCEGAAVARLLYFLAAIDAGQVSKLERDAGTPLVGTALAWPDIRQAYKVLGHQRDEDPGQAFRAGRAGGRVDGRHGRKSHGTMTAHAVSKYADLVRGARDAPLPGHGGTGSPVV
jgi:hypothetical protein